MSKKCKWCGGTDHTQFYCRQKPRTPIKTKTPLPRPTKRIRQVSDKQAEYHIWLEAEARPYLINRDGNKCSCCGRPALEGEKLDIEHTLNKGGLHADKKRDLNNLTLMCRYPCHDNKTNNRPCTHGFKVYDNIKTVG